MEPGNKDANLLLTEFSHLQSTSKVPSGENVGGGEDDNVRRILLKNDYKIIDFI